MKAYIIVILAMALIMAGCSVQQGIECETPLSVIDERCCLDANWNSVCDVDEEVEAEDTGAEKEVEGSDKDEPSAEKETIVEDVPTEAEEEEEQAEEEPVAESMMTQAEAERIAKLFATNWQTKQYRIMYKMFTPDLLKQKTSAEFVAIMELDPFYKKINKVDYKGVRTLGKGLAEMELEAHTNVQDIEIPAAMLEFTEGAWRVRAFVDVFSLNLFDAACSGYRYSNAYKTSDCAYDLSKKVNDAQYCNRSECHYVECLKAVGKPAAMTQEAEQCRLCQPPMKTVNDCILDVAIKHDKVSACNVIDDEHYSDKYCACYGGFARYKGTPGYCNMITNPDYKDACMKGYEGKYC